MSLLAIALVLILTGLEMAWPARREPTQRLVNSATWILKAFASTPLVTALGAVAIRPVEVALHVPVLHTGGWPTWLAFVWFIAMADFAAYAFHRAQHAVPFLWTWHKIHHSDTNMCALTTERHFWGDPFAKALTQGPFLAMVVDPTPAMVTAMAFIGLWNYVTHANLAINFGRFSWVLNSPAYHRIHHSSDPAHFNVNFAAIFPIYDLIFRTYRAPAHGELIATGLAGPPPRPAFALWPYLRGKPDLDRTRPAQAERA